MVTIVLMCRKQKQNQRMSPRYRGDILGLARGAEQCFDGLQDEDGTKRDKENTLALVSEEIGAHPLLEDNERHAGKTDYFDNHYFKL